MRLSRKLIRLFVKTFSITIIAAVLVLGAGWLTLQGMNKPPIIEPPQKVQAAESQDIESQNVEGVEQDHQPAYIVHEYHPDDEKIGDDLDKAAEATPAERKPLFYTFLVFGTDMGINTDSIMVGAYDGTAQKAYVIGIPRDTKVNVQRKVKKINGAYPAGNLNGGGHDGGVNQLRREIRTLIGFVPDFYISVNFDAFTDVVDTLGGLDINVPYNMQYDDVYQDLSIHFSEGLHNLSGQEALAFARHRQNNELRNGKWVITETFTDYNRIDNQQQVIQAVVNKILQPSNIFKVPEFINLFNKYVKTDLTNIVWFGDQLLALKDKESVLETHVFPTSGTSGAPDWYELPDEAAILELVNKTVNPYLKDIKAEDLSLVP